MKGCWCIVLGMIFMLSSCQQDVVSDDASLSLLFSHDSLLFDTVFTTMGSSTRRMMVYNPNEHAVVIDRVEMASGRSFYINLDGENRVENMRDMLLRGGDSLFLFVRAEIDPQSSDSPVLIEDTIFFHMNGGRQMVYLQAYGQDVVVVRDASGRVERESMHLTGRKPYVIYDTLLVGNLEIEQGATLYMHSGALIYVLGDLVARGTLDEPIVIRGDRMDQLFDSVPYRVASGQWNGLYLVPSEQFSATPTYELNYVDVLSGSVGLYALSERADVRPSMYLRNSRIHNHSIYGLVLQNVDADVVNTEISNCGSYCVYLSGGMHRFVHNTIASYYGYPYTTINIHNNILRDDVAAVYINNLSKKMAPTVASFCNCIVTGARENNMVLATPLADYYEGRFAGNYMRADSLKVLCAGENRYASDSDSVVFRNIYYLYKEYKYYDFQLDSLSPARGVGMSLDVLEPLGMEKDVLEYDRLGVRRKENPDAGCYEYLEK